MSKTEIRFQFPESERKRFRDWAYSLKSENMEEVRKLIKKTLSDTERFAKLGAPVDKGRLRSSIRMNLGHEELGGSVGSNVKYAPYQEFGTGKWVFKNYSQYNRILPGLEKYASQFKGEGKRKVNIYPKAYLFPAFNLGVRSMMLKLDKMGFKKK